MGMNKCGINCKILSDAIFFPRVILYTFFSFLLNYSGCWVFDLVFSFRFS